MSVCPSCQAVVKKGSSFCRYCGHQLPVVVGVSYPYGIRFPAVDGDAAVVALARTAPKYSLDVSPAGIFYTALYDRLTLPQLADLHRAAFLALPRGSIMHTVDGRTFFGGSSFWACMSRRLNDEGVFDGEVEHWSARCHSFFGCISAQKRQHAMYHREGWEVFYPGRHGRFADSVSGDEANPCPEVDTGRHQFFYPDRAKIQAEVLQLAKRSGCNRCPMFSPAYLAQQVKKIPLVLEFGVTPDCGWFRCQLHGDAAWWRVY
jgi:hypothetical protein